MPALLGRLAERMAQISGASAAGILLLDEEEQVLRPGAYYGYGDEDLRGLRIPLGQGFAGRVAAERRPLAIPDVSRDSTLLNQSIRRRGIQSLLGVPIAVEGKVLGVAHVDRMERHNFTQSEVLRLSAMAAQAALGIQHAILYDRLRAANDQLAAANRKLETLIGTIPAGVAILEAPSGRVVSANAAAEQLWGHRPVLGAALEDLPAAYGLYRPNGDFYHWRSTPMARSLHSGQTMLGEDVLLRRADGRAYTVLVSSAALRDASGCIDGAVVIFQDTSGVELERVKDQFVSVTAHELYTPLTVIKGTAQLLERKAQQYGINGEVTEGLEAIIGRTNVMSHMLQKLADASQLQLAPLRLRRSPTDLVAISRLAIQRFQPTTRAHEIVLASKLERLVGYWDRDRLGRVLANLLENAIKYSPGGGRVEVSIRRVRQGTRQGDECVAPYRRWVVVRVKDEGLGIPKEEQCHLFQRFYRAGPANYQESSGLGLGLYIANRIVTAHGGRMHVESAVGHGSRFFFTLPMESALESECGGPPEAGESCS